ncbi:MAG: hypothetical protein ACTHW1_04795 [Ancrocorticia sp.]|uniref:hypothetical protein n=1 Tax=Ancrocorticia sp. TaxID=2593684 RepID=UPI003F91F8AE
MNENPSILTAREIVAALIGCGVRHVAYCPGSRDAPFAYTLAAAEAAGDLEVATFSEERGAGFWAIGASKAGRVTGTGPSSLNSRPNRGSPDSSCSAFSSDAVRASVARPNTSESSNARARQVVNTVAVITTSGTAVAELHPALEEAYFQGLPILAITADRPHEMRGVGASQTTHQEGIFGSSVVVSDSLPAFESVSESVQLSIRNRVGRLVSSARGFMGQSGPAHLNVAFREPLIPVGAAEKAPEFPSLRLPQIETAERSYPAWDAVVAADLRTVVVAGDGADRSVVESATTRGIPVLAEPSSGVTDCGTWIPYEQWVIGVLGEQIQQVVVTGRPTLSRPVGSLLNRPDIRKIIVATHREWVDIAGTAAVVVEGLSELNETDSDEANEWLTLWRDTAAQVEARGFGTPVLTPAAPSAPAPVLKFSRTSGFEPADTQDRTGESNGILDNGPVVANSLSLLTACRMIWQQSNDSSLWLGASNTIRGFDLAAGAPGRGDVYSNRGLAGIDGTIASALGLAMASRKPVRAVMGDMTFAYDLATLAQRPEGPEGSEGSEAAPDIQLIVLDDGGGSIFASLEHGAARQDLYDRFFAVKPHLDVGAAARAAGWAACSISSLDDLGEELQRPIRGRSVLHVHIPWPTEEIAAARTAVARATTA